MSSSDDEADAPDVPDLLSLASPKSRERAIDAMSSEELKAWAKRQCMETANLGRQLRAERTAHGQTRASRAALASQVVTTSSALRAAHEGRGTQEAQEPMFLLDDAAPSGMVAVSADARRLGVAMAEMSREDADRKTLAKILQLDDRNPEGATDFDRRSPKKAFLEHQLSVDMWGDVGRNPELFCQLWRFCVHPKVASKDAVSRRRHGGGHAPRAFGPLTRKVPGSRDAMPWTCDVPSELPRSTGLSPGMDQMRVGASLNGAASRDAPEPAGDSSEGEGQAEAEAEAPPASEDESEELAIAQLAAGNTVEARDERLAVRNLAPHKADGMDYVARMTSVYADCFGQPVAA